MKIAIIGGSGFIGTQLRKVLEGFEVTDIKGRDILSMSLNELKDQINGQDVLINLAGKSVFGYWTRKRKKSIWKSRVDLTDQITRAMALCKMPPGHFINASAIGIYESEKELSEKDDLYSNNFLAEVVKNWEVKALNAKKVCELVSIIRIGVVLGKEGGMYRLMRTLVRFNLGAYFGKGRQSLSFIYIQDLVRAIAFIIDRKIDGVVNLTAPESSDYRTFTGILKRKLKALIVWPIPEFLIRILLGEMNVIVLEGQNIKPDVLVDNKFTFEAKNIQDCINLIEKP